MATKLLPSMQYEPMTEMPTGKPQGLLQRIAANPMAAQLMLSGLGLIGSRRQSEIAPYLKMSSDALTELSRQPYQKTQMENLEAQSRYYDAQAAAEGKTGLWDEGSATLNALNAVSTLGPLVQAGNASPQQVHDFKVAKAHLERQQLSYGPGGRPIMQGGMNFDFMGGPETTAAGQGTDTVEPGITTGGGAIATPVVTETMLAAEQMYPDTPAQISIDKKMADEYNKWTQGGFADVEKSMTQLYSALGDLESGKVQTGDWKALGSSLLPDKWVSFLRPDFMDTREKVEEVAQRNLRAVLGGQFAMQEGDRLISRAYNPNVKTEQNADRIRRLIKSIADAAEAKQEAMAYYGKNGTMKGYAPDINSFADLQKRLESDFLKTAEVDDTETTSKKRYYNPDTGAFQDEPIQY